MNAMAGTPNRTMRRGVVKPMLLPKRARAEIARASAGGGVRPTKGGDGGIAVAEAMLHDGSFAHDRDNSRRHATCARVCETLFVPTCDPFDVAHGQRTESGGYYLPQTTDGYTPRAGLAGCPPRLYPRSQVVGTEDRVVAFDSMFDGLAARVRRLEADGHDLGTRYGAVSSADTLRALDESMPPEKRLRDSLHGRTRERMTAEELALERMGSAWLRRGERE